MTDQDKFREEALEYHRQHPPGKIKLVPTKALTTARDLALAYSPGVAAASEEIAKAALKALDYTARGNLDAVVPNGPAALGLCEVGAAAAKPVVEGNGVV